MELLFYVSAINNIFALCGIAGYAPPPRLRPGQV